MEYTNLDLLGDTTDDKQGILDIRIKQADGTQINIEIQVSRLETMVHRSLFYWSRMYATQLGPGEKYGLLRPCIAINIVNFNITALPSPHTTWHITEDQAGERLTNLFEMHFLELPKLDKAQGKLSKRLEGWMRFLAAESREELEMAIGQDEIYQRAYQQLEVLSMDEATRWQYEAREAWLKDEATRRYEARMEGKEEGLMEGEIKGEIKAAIAGAVAFLDIADDATIAAKLSLPIGIVRRLRDGEDAESIMEELWREKERVRA